MGASLKHSLPLVFFECTWQKAMDEAHKQHACDLWVYDWPDVDHDWLFGGSYGWTPNSPLARSYYYKVLSDIDHAAADAQSRCNERHYAPKTTANRGVTITVSSSLNGGAAAHDGQIDSRVLRSQMSVHFAPGQAPASCPMIRRELFANPVAFDYVMYGPQDGPSGSNFRWDLRDQQTVTPDPYFDLYGRTLKFHDNGYEQRLGELHLLIDRVADLWVRFDQRPIPQSVVDRVDPAQPLSYRVRQGGGYFGVAAVIEIAHLESGQIGYESVYGPSYPPGQMTPYSAWPNGWGQMSMDANGVIRHHNVDLYFRVDTRPPASFGLPTVGTYRMRYILLAYGYDTYDRALSSGAVADLGELDMSSNQIRVSRMPSLISYVPGMTDGIIPPFEVTYTKSPVLDEGIEFDAVFDIKNLTTFRFVVKVVNNLDFAVGLIVQVAGWHGWVHLAPGQTKYLAGGVSVSGISRGGHWGAYRLHPQTQYYGWGTNWTVSYVYGERNISMKDGRLSVLFKAFLTAPNNPDTLPPNFPALMAAPTVGYAYDPTWPQIKRYASDAHYGYESEFALYYPDQLAIARISRSISKPTCQPLLDPATFLDRAVSPWPRRVNPGADTTAIRCNAEKLMWNGTDYVWTPVNDEPIYLTREMMQEVAAVLGITEYVVIDGDDMRWLFPDTSQPFDEGSTSYGLWVGRFYTRGGSVIDDGAMRAVFQAVIDENAASWPNYRNIVVHPSVWFGTFVGSIFYDYGECMVGPDGSMVEVSGFGDLGSVSTRFLYKIRPEFQ